MPVERQAEAIWSGNLASGVGEVSASTTGVFASLPVSWASRTGPPDGRTSPEELLAAAHASCFAMALSAGLGRAGTPPDKLNVTATVTFDQVDGGWRVVSSHLKVRGRVPEAEITAFQAAAEAAKDGCPISQALNDKVALSVEANLEG